MPKPHGAPSSSAIETRAQFLPQDKIDELARDPDAIVSAAPCNSIPKDPGNGSVPANIDVGGIGRARSGPCIPSLGDITPRGANIYINPRFEMRVPAFSWGGLVFFVDAANAWLDKSKFQPWRLRYAIGPGLSIDSPIGPIALDLGFNVSRYTQFGESLVVFSFSIGRF
jgi:hypothetical protein